MYANIWRRVETSLTGTPSVFAASAATTVCGRIVPLEPKPPPTCGEWTLTCSGSRPKTSASVPRIDQTPWEVSLIINLPSSRHCATHACGSIALLCW